MANAAGARRAGECSVPESRIHPHNLAARDPQVVPGPADVGRGQRQAAGEDHAGPGLQGGIAVTIRPSAIPHGIGLYLNAWAASPGANGGLSLQIDLVQANPQCTGS